MGVLLEHSISIHALREEGDSPVLCAGRYEQISIHALREEGDPAWERQKQPRYLFLSTPSARRATQLVGAVSGAL